MSEIYEEEFKKFKPGVVVVEAINYFQLHYINTFLVLKTYQPPFVWERVLTHNSKPENHIELLPLTVESGSVFKDHWKSEFITGSRYSHTCIPWALTMRMWEEYKLKPTETQISGRKLLVVDSTLDLAMFEHITSIRKKEEE